MKRGEEKYNRNLNDKIPNEVPDRCKYIHHIECNNDGRETYLCSSNSTCQNCTILFETPQPCALNYPSLYIKAICQNNTYYYPNNISVTLSELNNVQCNDYEGTAHIPTEECLEDYYVIKCFNGYLTNTTYEFSGCLGNVVSIKHIDYKQIVCIPLSNGLFFKVTQCNGFINISSGLLARLAHIAWIIGVVFWIGI